MAYTAGHVAACVEAVPVVGMYLADYKMHRALHRARSLKRRVSQLCLVLNLNRGVNVLWAYLFGPTMEFEFL